MSFKFEKSLAFKFSPFVLNINALYVEHEQRNQYESFKFEKLSPVRISNTNIGPRSFYSNSRNVCVEL